jgi:LDH2 family malate/lactate/ureidoglycolate dehydrogenase
MRVFSADQLRKIGMQIFTACGTPTNEAAILVDHLVETSLMGLDSHGIMRYPQYVDGVLQGKIQVGAPVRIIKETPNTAVVDCGFNFGQVGARFMTDVVCAKASQVNIACVVSENCNHIGRLGAYIQAITEKNLVGFGVCNSSRHGHWVVPYGGREGRLATNPLAFGVPSNGPHPIILDMATSMISEGKIRSLMYQGTPIPEGFIQDAVGHPITDAHAFYEPKKGTILPLGSPYHGYKGFGLGLMVEILGGVLAGNSTPADLPYVNGLCLMAINPEAFTGTDTFKELILELSDYMTGTPPAQDYHEVVLPGELDFRTRDRRLVEGIPVDDSVWNLILESARKVDVSISEEA